MVFKVKTISLYGGLEVREQNIDSGLLFLRLLRGKVDLRGARVHPCLPTAKAGLLFLL